MKIKAVKRVCVCVCVKSLFQGNQLLLVKFITYEAINTKILNIRKLESMRSRE